MFKNNKIVVFDVDETLGCFTQLGIFCDCLDEYYGNKNYSVSNFNKILDLYPNFVRPKMLSILEYLKEKKKKNKCYKVMMYTNNQGPKKWVLNIKNYFDYKINYKLFDQIIAAFKVSGEIVEPKRTSHDKSIDDFFRCTKLSPDVEICFIDDLFHYKMEDEKVYYINVKPYKYNYLINDMIKKYLKSSLGLNIINKSDFYNDILNIYNKFEYPNKIKDIKEQEIDEIVSKKMYQHIKQFFYENNKNTLKIKKKFNNKNKSLRNKKII